MKTNGLKPKKIVFPAAGFGTRFLPATKSVPKEMLPIVDRPLIQNGVDEAVASGLDEIIIVTSRGKSAIEDYFDVSGELEVFLRDKGKDDLLREMQAISRLGDFTYIRQKDILGLGHAVLCAKKLVHDEPFGVLLSDDIIDASVPVMKQMIDVYERYPYSILAVERVPESEVHRYGVIKGEKIDDGLYSVSELVEKPARKDAPSNLAIIGRYILNPGIFDSLSATHLGRGGELQLTDGIANLLKKEPVYAFEFEGDRYDAGDKIGFLKANIVFALKNRYIKDDFKDFIGNLKV